MPGFLADGILEERCGCSLQLDSGKLALVLTPKRTIQTCRKMAFMVREMEVLTCFQQYANGGSSAEVKVKVVCNEINKTKVSESLTIPG